MNWIRRTICQWLDINPHSVCVSDLLKEGINREVAEAYVTAFGPAEGFNIFRLLIQEKMGPIQAEWTMKEQIAAKAKMGS